MGGEAITIDGVFPFTSVNDLKRMIWYRQGGDPRWAPDRVFLGIAAPEPAHGYRPIEFYWPTKESVYLPDPMAPENRRPSPLLIDETGNRRPLGVTMIGSFILEAALKDEMMSNRLIPQITAIPLSALQPLDSEEISALFYGFYQLYFPWLAAPGQVFDAVSTIPTPKDKESYAAVVPYLEDRMGRISIVQRALAARVGGTKVVMANVVKMRWTLPIPTSAPPDSLEKTFYSLKATATLPFLRYFPLGGKGAPLLKLALKSDGSPVLSDDKVFAHYLSQPPPANKGAVILARAPLTSIHAERGAAFTIHMFEGGDSDVTLEVPQRGMTYIAAVAADAQRILRDVLINIGFPPTAEPVLHELHATYQWTHPDPRRAAPISQARLLNRVASLTPFLDIMSSTTGLASFKWRAVSNYESESAQFSFISQMVQHDYAVEEGEGEGMSLSKYVAALSERFGITQDAAATILERWMEHRSSAVAPSAIAGALAVPKHSTGATITIGGIHPEYTIELQGTDSWEEVQRALSVVGVLLGASTADLNLIPPVASIEAVGAIVEMADAALAEGVIAAPATELVELDPALADLMGEIDFGFDFGQPEEAEPEAEAEAEAKVALVISEAEPISIAAPNLAVVMAGVEEECRGSLWQAGEPPLKIPAEYYMARLKKGDMVLFGYSTKVGGRTKGYSKTCQRQDERQPNIMTLAEYARVRRCYKDRVRFVDLPPRSPADLPTLPVSTSKKKPIIPDEFFMTDPETGRPMWTVYGYESKTAAGEFRYLICAELWCERDNMPLVRSEFEGEAGRGFAKPPNSCPFCGGVVIANIDEPRSGESVIVRLPKGATKKLHSYIGTIQVSNKHPQGYPLPCCDTTPRILKKYLEAQRQGTIVYGKDLATLDDEAAAADQGLPGPEVEEEEDYAEPPAELGLEVGLPTEEIDIDYVKILGSMHQQYVLGANRLIDAGKLGLLPSALDAFFGQDGPQSIIRRGISKRFADGATLFVRLGVDNRLQAVGMNLFAALAPLMGYHSAAHARREIIAKSFVRAFESANYGTLLTEFAARATLTDREIESSLNTFAGKYGYDLGPNRPHVIRLYKAWSTYMAYLADDKKGKQLRHIEHVMAQPGILMPRGLLFVVLEMNPATEKIEVICPSFGIPTSSVFGDVPIAFLWHNRQDDSWEPLVLYNGSREAVRYFGERSAELELLPKSLRGSLQKWLHSWRSSSLGCGRPAPPPHVWTPDRDTHSLPRLSLIVKDGTVSKLVRDRSNRLAGVILNTMYVPCLDDGSLMDKIPRIFEAETIPPVALEAYLKFYSELAVKYPSLKPVALLSRKGDESQIIGFRTQVGTMIPVAPTPRPTTSFPVNNIDEFSWELDAKILKDMDTSSSFESGTLEESTARPEEQLAEAYQYLRLSLSRWLVRDVRGLTMRTSINVLLKQGLPLYEKRKRMDILLGPLISEWVAIDQTTGQKALSLLRQDCLTITEKDACEGSCSWSDGRCLIHAPGTDPVRIFTARLSDEILRYPSQRRELMEGSVSAIRTPRGLLRIGDELYIATKPKEPAAAIMMRLGFTGQQAMRFPEEMLRFAGLGEDEEEEEEESAAQTEKVSLSIWTEKGATVPTPPASLSLEEARRLAFAGSSGISFEEWENNVKARRAALKLPGDPDRPFQWSVQDMYVIARLSSSNVIFARAKPLGGIQIDRWIKPSASIASATTRPFYIIFWGPRQLLLAKGNDYRFSTRNLPEEFKMALDGASPLSEEEARGFVDIAPVASEVASEVAPVAAEVAPVVAPVAPVVAAEVAPVAPVVAAVAPEVAPKVAPVAPVTAPVTAPEEIAPVVAAVAPKVAPVAPVTAPVTAPEEVAPVVAAEPTAVPVTAPEEVAAPTAVPVTAPEEVAAPTAVPVAAPEEVAPEPTAVPVAAPEEVAPEPTAVPVAAPEPTAEAAIPTLKVTELPSAPTNL